MKTALLVIDVQNALFNSEPRPFEAATVIDNINQLINQVRKQSHPVIFIQHEQEGSVLEFGGEGWKLQQDLIVQESDHVIRKTTPDSFLNTDLQATLITHDIKHLIICGYATEYCVDTTSRRAIGLGYPVNLVADAHTTDDKNHASAAFIRLHHNITLPNIKGSAGAYVSVITTSELLAAG